MKRFPVLYFMLGLTVLLLPQESHAQTAGSSTPPEGYDPHDAALCGQATDRVEHAGYSPGRLLTAISHVESGRWDSVAGLKVAWPWTINANGVGHFFASKNAAIAEVIRLQRAGVALIDVGCMQINLHYHRNAFANLEAAFDPNTNVAYAVSFLRDLAVETGSWMRAAARYHSAEPDRASIYHAKVIEELRSLDAPPNPSVGRRGLQFAAVTVPRPGAVSMRVQPSYALPIDPQVLARQEMEADLAAEEHQRNIDVARNFANDWRKKQLELYRQSQPQDSQQQNSQQQDSAPPATDFHLQSPAGLTPKPASP